MSPISGPTAQVTKREGTLPSTSQHCVISESQRGLKRLTVEPGNIKCFEAQNISQTVRTRTEQGAGKITRKNYRQEVISFTGKVIWGENYFLPSF